VPGRQASSEGLEEARGVHPATGGVRPRARLDDGAAEPGAATSDSFSAGAARMAADHAERQRADNSASGRC
jgi:hypothetical protein